MTEIAISIRTENNRRSLAASIRVSVGASGAREEQTALSVESELGQGPLLPEYDALPHPFDAFTIKVGPDFGR